MWGGADNTVISIDDPSALGDMVSKRREALLNNPRAAPLGCTHESDGLTRARRASASDYEAYKQSRHNPDYWQSTNPDYSHTRARISQVHGDYDRDGDRGASNEVTSGVSSIPSSGVLVNPDTTVVELVHLPPVRTTTARPPPFDSLGAEGTGVMIQAPFATRDSSIPTPPSDLSRESSSELEKMLVNKLQLKILLAEDNAINQKVASRQLEKHGHSVTIVGDGQQALDSICALHDEFDLVLMDVQVCRLFFSPNAAVYVECWTEFLFVFLFFSLQVLPSSI